VCLSHCELFLSRDRKNPNFSQRLFYYGFACFFRVLAAYAVFAISDSFFHFTPEKSYISTLGDMVSSVIGGGSSATTAAPPVPAETIAPIVSQSVDAVTSLMD
jgi:hypothetical protein